MLNFLSLAAVLPEWYRFGTVFVFGAIIGSFLNVVIYRFHTGKSINGNSHCLSCATPLRWFELFPLVSYLGLLGRCRSCGSRIPSRYFLVELLTGLLFVAVALVATSLWQLVWLWFVMAVLVVITVYDINHFIIPDKLTSLLLGGASALLAERVYAGYQLGQLMIEIVAALAGAAFLLVIWFATKGRGLGFGDVKLAVPLGLLVGATQVFSFIVLSFWIGAVVSLLVIGWQRLQERGKPYLHSSVRQLTMKSAVPFAPFLIAGCLAVLFTSFNVLTFFSFM